jgi:hypothetical protein
MAEIHLKMVEYAQFKFYHFFWSNFVQFGRNSIHGWFVCADSGLETVWKHFDQFLEHIFKKMGSTEIVVSSVRLSVCPSVRLSVRLSPISQPL